MIKSKYNKKQKTTMVLSFEKTMMVKKDCFY